MYSKSLVGFNSELTTKRGSIKVRIKAGVKSGGWDQGESGSWVRVGGAMGSD